ncbi:hypothetical protein FIBSPDRAFT_960457 [Athelia psychrophila]|uniref:Uncharacterized protein n=1 Tax=Athelia psychrophila TaxID=1759441 RepID=A0A166CD63_9AGAM|nr:hypothetical protein FIBSPDRAFT_960457 [Fibularhizoctonia sp. CBS 109695]
MVSLEEWQAFNVELIQAHFRNDNSAASSLPEFVSAELARLSQGCSSDGQHMQAASSGFHPARQSSPSTRKVTRGYGLHVVRDMTEALDRTTSLGSITFHIHGESVPGSTPGETIRRNSVVYVSQNLANNSAATAGIQEMRAIFENSVAVPFIHDWLHRSVSSKTLSASVLSPPSSPVKRLDTHHSGQKNTRLAPLSPSILSVSSLTESLHSRPDTHRLAPLSPSISSVSSLTESLRSSPSSPVKQPDSVHSTRSPHLTLSMPSPSSTSSQSKSNNTSSHSSSSKDSTPTRRSSKLSFSSSMALDTGFVSQDTPDYSALSHGVIDFLDDIGKLLCCRMSVGHLSLESPVQTNIDGLSLI